MRALVILPTYEEAASITEAVARVLAADPRCDVLVVDDASPDGTGLIADRLARECPRVHVLHRAGKAGLGAAYRAGFTWALGEGYDAAVQMDADLSHPAGRLPALLDGLARAHVVIGSRYVRGGSTDGWAWRREVLSRAGNAYVSAALRLGVRDATAGFRALRAGVLPDLLHTSSEGYCFQVETTLRCVRAGLVVCELPITFTERLAGVSKMRSAIVAEALLRVTGWALSGQRAGRRRHLAAVPEPFDTASSTLRLSA